MRKSSIYFEGLGSGKFVGQRHCVHCIEFGRGSVCLWPNPAVTVRSWYDWLSVLLDDRAGFGQEQ